MYVEFVSVIHSKRKLNCFGWESGKSREIEYVNSPPRIIMLSEQHYSRQYHRDLRKVYSGDASPSCKSKRQMHIQFHCFNTKLLITYDRKYCLTQGWVTNSQKPFSHKMVVKTQFLTLPAVRKCQKQILT